ncbi:AAA family ATPase [Olleya sp. YS]|uniref:AAA family ATPase n=1 Tax=Olleya sp. YS TaxID=3028318 RepID=UPI00243467CB|nr:AAA family ATPase [Olleya sp. YS]WGD35644.1 AAA family ATPase [Olleya sp. YS]
MDLLKGGAVLAVIVGFWDKIKTFLWMGLSTFIQKAEIKTEDIHNEVIGHLIKNNKKFKGYDKVFASQYESFRNGKYGLVPYEKFGDSLMIFLTQKKYFFKLFRIPFVFTTNSESSTKKEGNNEQNVKAKSFSFIISLRGTIDVAKIVEEATIRRNQISWDIEEAEEKTNRFDIYYFPERDQDDNSKKNYGFGYSWFMQSQYKLIGVNHNDLGRELKNKGNALDNLFFPKEIEKLINIISLWVKSKDWYNQKNIPWKRGWLLYGIPGTGKTALARAFAEDLDLPIYFFSLAQMSNDELIKAWQSMQLNVPCIALIEDIDNVFDKRKNIAQISPFQFGHQFNQNNNGGSESKNRVQTPLTFDTLLNCIDGVDKTDGVFTIITTNDISKIDEAIGQPRILEDGTQEFVSTRPGRIDRAIELSYMSNENKIKMAEKILFEFPNKIEDIKLHILKNLKETPAQFQEYCSQIALEEYWNKTGKQIPLNNNKNNIEYDIVSKNGTYDF